MGGLLALALTPAFWPISAGASPENRDEFCQGYKGTALWGQCTRAVASGCAESEFAHPRCQQWAEQWEDQTGETPPWVVCGGDGVCTVFITSEQYDGNLGGLDGANEKCNQLAAAAGLEGTYSAWLSTDEDNDPESLFTHAQLPYRSVGEQQNEGPQIAANWTAWTTGTLDSLPQKDEAGNDCNAPGAGCPFWSATVQTGAFSAVGGTCNSWTDNVDLALFGSAGALFVDTPEIFSSSGSTAPCEQGGSIRVLCFEQ